MAVKSRGPYSIYLYCLGAYDNDVGRVKWRWQKYGERRTRREAVKVARWLRREATPGEKVSVAYADGRVMEPW